MRPSITESFINGIYYWANTENSLVNFFLMKIIPLSYLTKYIVVESVKTLAQNKVYIFRTRSFAHQTTRQQELH